MSLCPHVKSGKAVALSPLCSIDPDQNMQRKSTNYDQSRKLRSINVAAAFARTLMCDAARTACEGQV